MSTQIKLSRHSCRAVMYAINKNSKRGNANAMQGWLEELGKLPRGKEVMAGHIFPGSYDKPSSTDREVFCTTNKDMACPSSRTRAISVAVDRASAVCRHRRLEFHAKISMATCIAEAPCYQSAG